MSAVENTMAATPTGKAGARSRELEAGHRAVHKAKGDPADALGPWQLLGLRLVLPAMFVVAWSLASTSPSVAAVLPSPVAVLGALWDQLLAGHLLGHLGASLGRAFAGFFVAAAIGIAFGLAMSQSMILRQILAGPVELLRPISSIAWIPLAILWFGIGFTSVVFVIVVSCLFIILLNTLAAASDINRDLVKAALTLGASRWQVFTKVSVPSALPGIMLGLRIAMTGAWGGVLVAEMIATQQGLGYMIVRAQASYQPALVIGGMLVVGIVGYALNALFLVLQRRLTHA